MPRALALTRSRPFVWAADGDRPWQRCCSTRPPRGWCLDECSGYRSCEGEGEGEGDAPAEGLVLPSTAGLHGAAAIVSWAGLAAGTCPTFDGSAAGWTDCIKVTILFSPSTYALTVSSVSKSFV